MRYTFRVTIWSQYERQIETFFANKCQYCKNIWLNCISKQQAGTSNPAQLKKKSVESQNNVKQSKVNILCKEFSGPLINPSNALEINMLRGFVWVGRKHLGITCLSPSPPPMNRYTIYDWPELPYVHKTQKSDHPISD